MRLKLFEKAISKIGQIFKKMASSSSANYQKLNCTANATAYDPENEKISGSSYSSPRAPTSVGSSDFSSAYISPNVSDKSPSWLLDFEKLNLKKPSSQFDSMDISNIRVTLPPSDPWNDLTSISNAEDSVKTHNSRESFSDNFRIPLSNCNSNSTYSTTFSEFTYSMLSSTFDEGPIWEDFDYQIPPLPEMHQESIALDFEMNGKTTDIITFEPRISSTPFPSRKYEYPEYFAPQQENVYASEPAQACFKAPRTHQSVFEPIETSTAAGKNIPMRNNFNKMPEKRTSKVKPLKKSLADHCVFCKNNGAEPAVYNSHKVMDAKGRCLCPMLRQYKCPICNADGDNAHTTKYCPKKKIFTETDMKRMKSRSRSKALKF